MNSDCDKEYLDKLYDDLEKNPLVFDNDYLELIYKRATVLVNKNEALTEKQILDNIEIVKKGCDFNKYGKDDKPNKRFFQLTNDSKEIIWYNKNGCKLFRTIKRIRLDEIINIYIGINSSKLFDKFNIPSSNDQQCMSIFCENKVYNSNMI